MIAGVSITFAVLTTCLAIIVKDPPTEYKYSYDIQDPVTGDTKSQHEVKNGDVVSGSYSVIDPDGTRRTVKYTADNKHGFKATVVSEPVNYEPARNDENDVKPNYYRYTTAVAANTQTTYEKPAPNYFHENNYVRKEPVFQLLRSDHEPFGSAQRKIGSYLFVRNPQY